MLYNNGRLIEMYVKAAVQKEKNDLMMWVLSINGGSYSRTIRVISTNPASALLQQFFSFLQIT